MLRIELMTDGIDFSNAFLILTQGIPPGSYESLAVAEETGAIVLRYGTFFNEVITFLFIAFPIFLLLKYVNKLHKKKEESQLGTYYKRLAPFAFLIFSLRRNVAQTVLHSFRHSLFLVFKYNNYN